MLLKATNFSTFQKVKWPIQNVLAYTTTRISPSPNPLTAAPADGYAHFNLASHVGDNIDTVLKNRKQLAKLFPSDKTIQFFEQVHGNHVEYLAEPTSCILTADAAVTSNKHIALAIVTADCLPILLSSDDGSEVAAIHGGWRPLSGNIIENTLRKMSTVSKQITAWLGPCIGANAFEVGENVFLSFINQDETFQNAFKKIAITESGEQKYLANLHRIAEKQLQLLGINKIFRLPHCTVTEKHLYYSYRRDGDKTGRMATVISPA